MAVTIVHPPTKAAPASGFSLAAPSLPADIKLGRQQVADALTAAGFPISRKTLENMAWRGEGPPYAKFGKRAVYGWASALEWANDRLK
ncbi:hypothetical protein AAFN86_16000 [Roseomonas sp. CAU 1739]|uniref:helix-turn-helix transcriptional regulator n=1 Tax=Roseomonas sp. CAU 1739 TaxID=3140364 RepID=UPI00325B9D99